ncbi:MAG: hypoxanthine phosphoribosyltransferase [Cyanobacteria bacterium P01_F01_bin.42]
MKPTHTEADFEKTLIAKDEIQARVKELGAELDACYRDSEVLVVAILSGSLLFAADLMRNVSFPSRLDFLSVSSYGDKMSSSGLEPSIVNTLKNDITGQNILIVDDILDTGKTLQSITRRFAEKSPASIKTCVLLDKPSRRSADLDADFKGFTIPDAFVVGYGLDFAERYRNLSSIGTLKLELQDASLHKPRDYAAI